MEIEVEQPVKWMVKSDNASLHTAPTTQKKNDSLRLTSISAPLQLALPLPVFHYDYHYHYHYHYQVPLPIPLPF